jgi:hypothetical protein
MLQEAEKHMMEGTKQFDNATDDCSNVGDRYLEPLRMDLDHMPDYAKLEKPKRPPVPEVSGSLAGKATPEQCHQPF